MATKSRLGKGLGALFPSLPGESAKSEAATEPAVAVAGAKADNKIAGKVSENVAGGVTVAGQSAGKTAVKSSVATAKASVDAVHDMKKNVSRETKKGSGHRASMPSITLNETAHPADMFFGSTSPVATSEVKQESVSRETAAVKKTEDKKNDEPELLPVQGGYLVELRLSDVGPNLHQPRTIFDEDDLRELADSIKEVGVLQPIVVRKRPLAQIEAARKENAAKDAESHNMFDGRMDSMYELIMGERRWRASQIAGLKTIPAIVKTTADDDMLRDALLENVTVDANGKIDFADKSVTENTRVSYPIYHIENIVKPVSKGPHAKQVIFLSADAFGVLPPVSILNPEQAQYYFLSGFTAKLAGTERGITEPTPTFSACFGAAFLSLHPTKYAEELVKKMEMTGAKAYLVNTGWNGSGKRISIKDTRGIIDAILDGSIDKAPTKVIPFFDFVVPTELPGVDPKILDPRDTYADPAQWNEKAKDLAGRFIKNFAKFTGNEAGKKLVAAGPKL